MERVVVSTGRRLDSVSAANEVAMRLQKDGLKRAEGDRPGPRGSRRPPGSAGVDSGSRGPGKATSVPSVSALAGVAKAKEKFKKLKQQKQEKEMMQIKKGRSTSATLGSKRNTEYMRKAMQAPTPRSRPQSSSSPSSSASTTTASSRSYGAGPTPSPQRQREHDGGEGVAGNDDDDAIRVGDDGTIYMSVSLSCFSASATEATSANTLSTPAAEGESPVSSGVQVGGSSERASGNNDDHGGGYDAEDARTFSEGRRCEFDESQCSSFSPMGRDGKSQDHTPISTGVDEAEDASPPLATSSSNIGREGWEAFDSRHLAAPHRRRSDTADGCRRDHHADDDNVAAAQGSSVKPTAADGPRTRGGLCEDAVGGEGEQVGFPHEGGPVRPAAGHVGVHDGTERAHTESIQRDERPLADASDVRVEVDVMDGGTAAAVPPRNGAPPSTLHAEKQPRTFRDGDSLHQETRRTSASERHKQSPPVSLHRPEHHPAPLHPSHHHNTFHHVDQSQHQRPAAKIEKASGIGAKKSSLYSADRTSPSAPHPRQNTGGQANRRVGFLCCFRGRHGDE